MAMTTMFLPMFGAMTPQDLKFGDHLDKSGNEMYFGRKVREYAPSRLTHMPSYDAPQELAAMLRYAALSQTAI